MHKCPRTSCKDANTRVYNSCAHIYARISMKFKTLTHKIVIDHHIKFHEDPKFCYGDICKTILVFFNRWFSMYFSYFPNNIPLKPSEMDNCWIIIKKIWKLDIKMYVSNAKKDTCLCLEFVAQAKQMVFISYLGSTCRIVLIAPKSLIYKKKVMKCVFVLHFCMKCR